MKKFVAACWLIFFACAVSCASDSSVRDRVKARMEARKLVKQSSEENADTSGPIRLPKGASLESDVAYGDDPAQRMDIYLPQQATGPVVFMVHGGAWMLGDKATDPVVRNKAAWLLPRGIILISTNYRKSRNPDPLEQADDVARALAAAQSKAETWGGDPERFVLMGHSAGAHLVALLAADSAIGKRQGARPWLGTVALDSQALNVVEIMEGRHARFYDRVFKTDPDYWRQASPIYRLSGSGAPMLLICSTRRDDSCPQARSFAATATTEGRKVSVLPIKYSHGEINSNLGVAGDYTNAVDSFLHSLGVDIK